VAERQQNSSELHSGEKGAFDRQQFIHPRLS
jgi:hypothetical protein